MTREEIEAFAERWAASWNAGAVEEVLAHYREDVTLTSPTALQVVGAPSVRGKDALRAYWTTALKRGGPLHFIVERVLWDPVSREAAIVYRSQRDGQTRRVSENLIFDENGEITACEVFHGVTA